MFLPKTQEYAVRCMAHIALLPWETSINTERLAEITKIPRDYMAKVLQKLSAAKLLLAEKGHHGGFRLSKAPSKITFLEILEATGYCLEPDRCISGWGKCQSKNHCPLHSSFSRLNQAIYEWALSTTLSEVTKSSFVLPKFTDSKS